jgi:flavin-dependent dehydrogenase
VFTARSNTDVFIIGGGPAGLAAAIAARRKGLQVIVADGAARPIEKPCGEGMSPETLAALTTLGVEFNPSDGFKYRGIGFLQDGAGAFADFQHGPGIGLRRPILHDRLVARAEDCGVQLLWRTPVSGINIEAGTVQLPQKKVCARWIVGADGQGSRVRRWAGLDPAKRSKRRYATRRHYRVTPWSNYMEVYWGTELQAYVTPIGREDVCIVMMSEQPARASFDRALSDFPELAQKLTGAALSSTERGAVSYSRSLHNVCRNNVALLGDASGSVDAITGDGLRLAFLQAIALADALVAGDLHQYHQAHRNLERRPMLMSDLLLWLGRNPRIRRRVICALQDKPELFARLLATHVGQATPGELLSAGALLSLRLLAS